jgi:hypothetical protein
MSQLNVTEFSIKVKQFDFSGRADHKCVGYITCHIDDFFGYFTGKGKAVVRKQRPHFPGVQIRNDVCDMMTIRVTFEMVKRMNDDVRSVYISSMEEMKNKKKILERFLSKVVVATEFTPANSLTPKNL